MPVNPHEVAIEGVLTYPSIDVLPLVPDLAVVATPPATVPEMVATLGALMDSGGRIDGFDRGKHPPPPPIQNVHDRRGSRISDRRIVDRSETGGVR